MTDPAIMPVPPGLPVEMTVLRAGRSVARSPDGIASGTFRVETLLSGTKDGEPTALRATFDPGVRTHWHSHPRGQMLFALSGAGLAQRRGGDVVELRAGDTVWFPPNEAHWHGAAADSPFSYLSIQAIEHGTAVHWLGAVGA
ncbi:cupin domain-containing protein [Labrys monachus]|uniref:Quercetin dioxygenase-like cupin family protein n=1 Tax=Labrys monachus TaxID=217067 RepID=A0ABU0FKJ2_9HYPH|nr:cupin domain-containing protein [Labrys monachus]MDQ0395119.1 quercetin dioxygenase-like cupin family protein [Labrys monachus]